jgi:ABC-type oligopeptide transport system substrate-binding subunit
MMSKARLRTAGALLGVLLASAACGSSPTTPEDKTDPKEPPPTEALLRTQPAPLYG